jgi:hypothetical protein
MRNMYKILVRKTEGKRPLTRRRSRWEDNIRINHREILWEVVDGMHLAQDRDQWRAVVNTVMNFRGPQNVGNLLTSWLTISLSRRTLVHVVS